MTEFVSQILEAHQLITDLLSLPTNRVRFEIPSTPENGYCRRTSQLTELLGAHFSDMKKLRKFSMLTPNFQQNTSDNNDKNG